jgi:hypothetical protein
MALKPLCCVCTFSLHRESPDVILGDEPLISEVVLLQSIEAGAPPWVCRLLAVVQAPVITRSTPQPRPLPPCLPMVSPSAPHRPAGRSNYHRASVRGSLVDQGPTWSTCCGLSPWVFHWKIKPKIQKSVNPGKFCKRTPSLVTNQPVILLP